MTLLIILICSLFGAVVIIVWAAVKAGADSDFQFAVLKCKKCKYYRGKDIKLRLIKCGNQWKLPEECMSCKKCWIKY